MTVSQLRAVVEIDGLTASEEMLKRMGDRAFGTEVLMEEIAEMLEIAARARLSSAPWKPLTSGTIARKASQGEDIRIMHDEWRPIGGTPTRKGDALYTALDGGPGSYKRATRTTATYGVHTNGDLFYARFVQNVKGTKRRLLAIDEATAITVTEMVGSWVFFGEGAGQSGYLRGSFGFKGTPTRGT